MWQVPARLVPKTASKRSETTHQCCEWIEDRGIDWKMEERGSKKICQDKIQGVVADAVLEALADALSAESALSFSKCGELSQSKIKSFSPFFLEIPLRSATSATPTVKREKEAKSRCPTASGNQLQKFREESCSYLFVLLLNTIPAMVPVHAKVRFSDNSPQLISFFRLQSDRPQLLPKFSRQQRFWKTRSPFAKSNSSFRQHHRVRMHFIAQISCGSAVILDLSWPITSCLDFCCRNRALISPLYFVAHEENIEGLPWPRTLSKLEESSRSCPHALPILRARPSLLRLLSHF